MPMNISRDIFHRNRSSNFFFDDDGLVAAAAVFTCRRNAPPTLNLAGRLFAVAAEAGPTCRVSKRGGRRAAILAAGHTGPPGAFLGHGTVADQGDAKPKCRRMPEPSATNCQHGREHVPGTVFSMTLHGVELADALHTYWVGYREA